MKNYGKTSTTVLREHLTVDHKIDEKQASDGSSKQEIQTKIKLKKKLDNFEPSSTQYDLNRDLVVWASLDLEPFMFTEKPGMKYFFEKNFPSMTLPSRSTMSRSALCDVYAALQSKVKEEFQSLKGRAVCIMLDGWSDKYKRYPYLGLRVAYVDDDWNYKVVTVSLKVVDKHTAVNMSAHVRHELADHGLMLNDVQVFTTHDGAANMVKTSQLLRSSHFQHCVAHSLHLLLVNDGINTIPELVDLLQRCKSGIIKLDAKGYIVEGEQAKCKDREVMNVSAEKMATVTAVLQADDEISLGTADPNDDEMNECENRQESGPFVFRTVFY